MAMPTEGGSRKFSLQFFPENSTARAMGFDHAIGEAADKLAMLTGGRFGICIGHPLVQ